MEQNDHIEAAVKIYFTTDYQRFKFLKGNRDINELKVKKIMKAIKGGVNNLPYAPIIVNENMEIIDGQHRYYVSMKLSMNVYYVIHRTADLSIVPTINSNSSKWKTSEFLASYVDLNKLEYRLLNEFLKSFPQTTISTAARIFHAGNCSDNEAMEAFRDGSLSSEHQDLAYDLAELLEGFKPYMDNPFSSRMYRAMLILKDNGKYDHELMLKKLAETERRIEDIGSPKSIIQNLESIVNHKARTRIIIN